MFRLTDRVPTAHRHGDRVGIFAFAGHRARGPQGRESGPFRRVDDDIEYQQANVMIDSHCHARLVDFGLAVVVDESAAGSAIETNGTRGTVRWMAPELMHSKVFDFTEESNIRLPSRGTDIYALGMTILEVSFLSASGSSLSSIGTPCAGHHWMPSIQRYIHRSGCHRQGHRWRSTR